MECGRAFNSISSLIIFIVIQNIYKSLDPPQKKEKQTSRHNNLAKDNKIVPIRHEGSFTSTLRNLNPKKIQSYKPLKLFKNISLLR